MQHKPWIRKLLKTTKVLFIILGVLGLLAFLTVYFYEDAVKKAIISGLNKNLNTRIEIKDIEKDISFSFFKTFPYASVGFKDIVVRDAIKDTAHQGKLLEASSLSLQFNVWNMLFGSYKIKKVVVESGTVALKIYKDKSDNYHIWKPSADSVKSDFAFDLQKVVLRKVHVDYRDYSRQQFYNVFAKDVVCAGKFSDKAYDLNINGGFRVNQIKIHNDRYMANRDVSLDAQLYVDNAHNIFQFKKAEMDIGKLPFTLSGTVDYSSTSTRIDLSVAGEKMKIQSFINELPERFRPFFNNYSFSGFFTFQSRIVGNVDEVNNPLFTASFNVSDASMEHNKTEIPLENISFQASYTNGKNHSLESSTLVINGFSASLKSGQISGNLVYDNFLHPNVHLKLDASLDLNDVFSFLVSDSTATASGQLVIHTEMKGSFQNISDISINDFPATTSIGTLEIKNGNIDLHKSNQKFSELNGLFQFNANDIESSHFSGRLSNSDFVLNGRFKNLIPYLILKNQPLQIDAGLSSAYIDLNEILEKNVSKKDTTYQLILPDNLEFRLGVSVKKLEFRQFQADNISGVFILKNRQFFAKDFALQSMGGRVSGNVLVDGARDGKLLISCDASIVKVNINQLFIQFENFGQKGLVADNIKGNVTADIQFASVWSNDFKVDKPTIYAKSDIVITNGQLINYEPLSGLKKYLKNRDLSHVSFETLKNTIEISNEKINIPLMEINSNAIDFKMNGTHTFEQEIDYHLSVLISQLGNRTKKTNTFEDVGVIEDDGLHKEKYFFRITGTVDNPEYHSMDKEGFKNNLNTVVKTEKTTMKEILNKEFGWFKKDSTLNKKTDNKNSYDFNVIWDEDDDKEGEE
jgi:hypothetical protein